MINTQYINGDDVDMIDHDTKLAISECDELGHALRAKYTERLGW